MSPIKDIFINYDILEKIISIETSFLHPKF